MNRSVMIMLWKSDLRDHFYEVSYIKLEDSFNDTYTWLYGNELAKRNP